jgi:hypothetical protein
MELMAEVSVSSNGIHATIYPYFECSGTASTLSSQSFSIPQLPSSSTFKKDHDRIITGKGKFGRTGQDEKAYWKSALWYAHRAARYISRTERDPVRVESRYRFGLLDARGNAGTPDVGMRTGQWR